MVPARYQGAAHPYLSPTITRTTGMSRQQIIRTTLVALGLLIGAGSLERSTLEASGYIIICGFAGDVSCEPGGSGDCASA